MVLTDKQIRAMLEASEPLMEWLSDNCHPHCMVMVVQGQAEVVEGIASAKTDKFIKD